MIDIFSPAVNLPKYYLKLLSSGDKYIAHSKKFLDGLQAQETTSKRNYKTIPSNATIRSEHVKCGKSFCFRCPHGPYYYAYWKDDNGKLKKKYVGIKYDDSWKNKVSDKNSPEVELKPRL